MKLIMKSDENDRLTTELIKYSMFEIIIIHVVFVKETLSAYSTVERNKKNSRIRDGFILDR